MFSLCDAQDAVELFSGAAESGNESGLDNGVSATGDKRERDLFEVSRPHSFTIIFVTAIKRGVRCAVRIGTNISISTGGRLYVIFYG